MSKIHVYFMPGLAASSAIFEQIQLPEDQFEIHLLEWFLPQEKQSLVSYAQEMAEKIVHENVILIGVSFGGILVQEMKPFVHPKKVVIISSVKSAHEFPKRFQLAKATKAYKLIPTKLFENIENLAKYAFGDFAKQRLQLYKKYLAVRDKNYLDWSIEQIINWNRTEIDPEVIHIHGDKDEVFPSKNIQTFIPVKNGTHVMILTKYKWLNENLPNILLEK